LWGIVSGKDAPPTDADLLEKYEKADAKALMLITLSLSDEVQPYIREATASSQAWSALCTIYEAKNLTTKLQLQTKLHTMSMHDGESVEAFLRRVAELRAELSALGEPVDDKLLVPLTLRALPSRFQTLITTLTITQQE
ncbi:hypothetical protein KI387_019271, partial [Taxus chinensis]